MNGTMSAVEINTDISLQERIASELSNRVEIPSTTEPLISSHEQTNEMPSTKTPLNISPPKSPSHLSVVQIGAPPPPHQRLSFGASEQPKSSSLKLSQEQTESKTSAELSHQGEKTNDLSDSDEELLSDLAREDLIRDTLSNAEHSIPDRSFAPSNSPDMRVRHGSRSSNHTSRQHSANINSVYGMLRAEQAFKTSTTLHRPQVSAYNSDVYSVYSEGRSVDWCSKIHNPDDTPNVSVKWANLWMGGGRDLHLEEMRSRPSSAHVPGWKDGLKGTARTRSAHTMRFAKTKNHRQLSATNYSSKTTSRNSTYNKQLEWQQYKFRPTNSSFRRSAGLSCLPHFNSTESLEYETRDC
ncbi:hypothetical protein EB796_023676 [Bugula neritina]|uniref:Uncharacterized protein n=1 Tax=Bugula neritina TaxID=10212 RepID=A0A7J7IW02_BUGNE|nr:hypothetical protein EB796_023676 [Bugula neritina]